MLAVHHLSMPSLFVHVGNVQRHFLSAAQIHAVVLNLAWSLTGHQSNFHRHSDGKYYSGAPL
jgi:hypothetical protein